AGFPTYHLMGIRPTGVGNVTQSHVAWHHDYQKKPEVAYVPSPIAADDYFFVVSDGGWAQCVNVETGKPMWKERLGRHHSASPVVADGRLYFLDDDGTMHVLRPGSAFEVTARNELGEQCRASPAIARGQILIRTLESLYCIGTEAK